jgi:hypothetical protein
LGLGPCLELRGKRIYQLDTGHSSTYWLVLCQVTVLLVWSNEAKQIPLGAAFQSIRRFARPPINVHGCGCSICENTLSLLLFMPSCKICSSIDIEKLVLFDEEDDVVFFGASTTTSPELNLCLTSELQQSAETCHGCRFLFSLAPKEDEIVINDNSRPITISSPPMDKVGSNWVHPINRIDVFYPRLSLRTGPLTSRKRLGIYTDDGKEPTLKLSSGCSK